MLNKTECHVVNCVDDRESKEGENFKSRAACELACGQNPLVVDSDNYLNLSEADLAKQN